MSYDKEFASLMSQYISQEQFQGRTHWVLNMKEYSVIQRYRTDKFSILEILQDIDIENKKNNKTTDYYNKFSQEQ